MPSKLLLKPEEAADELSMSRATLYQLLAAGIIPSIKIGRSRRIPASALADWVRQKVERGFTAEGESIDPESEVK